jgi:hypothetical protein
MVTNGIDARMFVSWKDGNDYRIKKFQGFHIQEPAHYREFRTIVRNIIDWGTTKRLLEIENALQLIETEAYNAAEEDLASASLKDRSGSKRKR